jgi:uncharacterized protein (TIGR02996 family)
MSDEHIFLRALHDRPNDDTTRLVYADWLDEQGTPDSLRRALFLRLDHERNFLPEDSPDRAELERRLQELAQQLPIRWTAQVSKRQLENCPVTFRFRCPKVWDQLTPTERDPMVRHCETCEKDVYYCESIEDACAHALFGRCIAIDARVARSRNDLLDASSANDRGELDFVGQPERLTLGISIMREQMPPPPPPRRSWWRWLFGQR